MAKTKKINLDGVEYTIQEMNLIDRNKVFFALSQIVGNGLEEIRGGFYSAISGSLKKLDPHSSAALMESILTAGIQFPRFQGNDFTLHFSEHYEHQFDLVIEILTFNYGKTYDVIKKKLEKIGILTPKSSKPKEQQEK